MFAKGSNLSTSWSLRVSFRKYAPRCPNTCRSLRGLPRNKVLATTVHLLETTLIRVGNEDYAKINKSFGLTTLRDSHAKINGSELRFQFKGKSGKTWRIKVKDRRVAKIVKACQDLPSQELLQYIDETGATQDIKSTDVNAYLKEITGYEITAKDFRTWAGTVLAALALREFQSSDRNATAKKTCELPSSEWRHG
jgi:DNA topoisomerase I